MESSKLKTLFNGLKSKCYHDNGRGEKYFTTERHSFLSYQHPVEYGDDLFLQCDLFSRTRSWTGDHHCRLHPPFLNIGLVHSGETAIRSGELYTTAKAGDAFFLAPDTEYEILTPHLCERSAILISGPLLREAVRKSNLQQTPVIRLESPEKLAGLLERFPGLLRDSYRHSVRRKISSLCFEVIQFLSSPETTPSLPEPLNRVLEKIGREYGKMLDVESLALHAGISSSTLTRLFKRHLGRTPHQYLTETRMRQAAQMLEQHTLSIKEIAARVGYENSLNFSTGFKKCFGESPKHFSAQKIPKESFVDPD